MMKNKVLFPILFAVIAFLIGLNLRPMLAIIGPLFPVFATAGRIVVDDVQSADHAASGDDGSGRTLWPMADRPHRAGKRESPPVCSV
ncbi:Uncharacterised protein [Pantoea agglomerans]|uniref:Uncharacterized protein n=1 Tax=Enterobacter agglomerans TaxID=549 RepID=A0A379LS03_ENTAG|nr:Uncharacterised protein [Pantoea agglomerans]